MQSLVGRCFPGQHLHRVCSHCTVPAGTALSACKQPEMEIVLAADTPRPLQARQATAGPMTPTLEARCSRMPCIRQKLGPGGFHLAQQPGATLLGHPAPDSMQMRYTGPVHPIIGDLRQSPGLYASICVLPAQAQVGPQLREEVWTLRPTVADLPLHLPCFASCCRGLPASPSS